MLKETFYILVTLACSASTLFAQGQRSFFLPELSGSIMLGINDDKGSTWIDNNYKGKDISLEWHELKDTHGYTLKVTTGDFKDTRTLYWAYGGCSGETQPINGNPFSPERCKDNVFSVEGTSFVVYYGNSRRLKVVNVVVPSGCDIRLCDARQMTTPEEMFLSGKKTDAPALCAALTIMPNSVYYFAVYKQNPKADYNVFMLPDLHRDGTFIVHTDHKWMSSTPN